MLLICFWFLTSFCHITGFVMDKSVSSHCQNLVQLQTLGRSFLICKPWITLLNNIWPHDSFFALTNPPLHSPFADLVRNAIAEVCMESNSLGKHLPLNSCSLNLHSSLCGGDVMRSCIFNHFGFWPMLWAAPTFFSLFCSYVLLARSGTARACCS